jgi:hypothetical protein
MLNHRVHNAVARATAIELCDRDQRPSAACIAGALETPSTATTSRSSWTEQGCRP